MDKYCLRQYLSENTLFRYELSCDRIRSLPMYIQIKFRQYFKNSGCEVLLNSERVKILIGYQALYFST